MGGVGFLRQVSDLLLVPSVVTYLAHDLAWNKLREIVRCQCHSTVSANSHDQLEQGARDKHNVRRPTRLRALLTSPALLKHSCSVKGRT